MKLKQEAPIPEEDWEEDELPRRKKKKWWILPVCILVLVTLVIASLPTAEDFSGSITVTQRVLNGTAQPGRIVTVLTGAGTLTPENTEDICVPDAVEVDSYHVRNGDAVRKGDVLATIKPTTVACAIAELQDVLSELDSALESKRTSEAQKTIYAPAGGRIKAIYIQPGEDVADVMLREGALMKLSLDGRMKVEIPGENLAVGQTLTVRLEDGKTLEGRVLSVRQGVAVVTVPDDRAELDAAVTVEDETGTVLGQGNLQINSEARIVGYYGTVSYVPVVLNQMVGARGTLIQLKDTGNTAEYDRLLNLRRELEDRMDSLYALYPQGLLRAEADGVVSGIPEDAEFVELTQAEKAEYGMLSAGQETFPLQFLSAGNVDRPRLVLLEGEGGDPVTPPGGDPSGDPVTPPGGDPGSGAAHYGTGIVVSVDPLMIQIGEGEPFAFTGTVYDSAGQSVTPNVGDTVFVASDTTAYLSTGGAMPGMPDMGGMGFDFSGMMGGFGGMGGTYVAPTPAYETYSLEETTLMKLSAQERMGVEVPVDELDILALKPGMEATVTLDAFKGETFRGTVERISRRGENSGGNTKFTVTVAMDGEARMLVGMNASVSVVTASHDAAITVPAAALQEIGGKTYLYTGYSQKEDTLLNPVEVLTGVSDDETVQILSGLEAGDTFYYRYADSITYSFARDL